MFQIKVANHNEIYILSCIISHFSGNYLFQLYIKQEFYLTDMNQNETVLTAFNTDLDSKFNLDEKIFKMKHAGGQMETRPR
jgi:hypothetical protein